MKNCGGVAVWQCGSVFGDSKLARAGWLVLHVQVSCSTTSLR